MTTTKIAELDDTALSAAEDSFRQPSITTWLRQRRIAPRGHEQGQQC